MKTLIISKFLVFKSFHFKYTYSVFIASKVVILIDISKGTILQFMKALFKMLNDQDRSLIWGCFKNNSKSLIKG